MDAFVINKDSWHYRFLAWYTVTVKAFGRWGEHYDGTETYVKNYEDYYQRPGDFCAYWRAVLLWPLVRTTVNLALAAAIAMLIVNLVSIGTVSVISFMWLTAFVVGGVVTISAWILVFDWFENRPIRSGKKKDGKQAGLISTAYRAYKENFCPYLKYEENAK